MFRLAHQGRDLTPDTVKLMPNPAPPGPGGVPTANISAPRPQPPAQPQRRYSIQQEPQQEQHQQQPIKFPAKPRQPSVQWCESTPPSAPPLTNMPVPPTELSAVDRKWGTLFDQHGVPTKRWEQVIRGIGNYLVSPFSNIKRGWQKLTDLFVVRRKMNSCRRTRWSLRRISWRCCIPTTRSTSSRFPFQVRHHSSGSIWE